VWNASIDDENNSVCFTYLSKAGEEGYPGSLLILFEAFWYNWNLKEKAV
jgi:galactose mutarotase-like enzyme